MIPKLIAFDLDNTFLDSDKRIPEANMRSIVQAHASGALIVPATGRFRGGMPPELLRGPLIRYVISINGAVVYDIQEETVLVHASMPLRRALDVMRFLDGEDVIYDCYIDNEAYMTKALQDKADDYITNDYYRARIRDLRTPVPDLPAFIEANGKDISKIQLFARDMALRDRLFHELQARFPDNSVTSSLPDNIEITDAHANKGEALEALCRYLDIPLAETFAAGDGLNDVTMLQCAGTGVAMANAPDAVKQAAGFVTASCDEEGFARALLRVMEAKE